MLNFLGLNSARISRPATGAPNPLHPGWAEATRAVVTQSGRSVRLRPLLRRDGRDWAQQRILDEAILRPVDPTVEEPWEVAHSRAAYLNLWAYLRKSALEGDVVPLVVEVDGHFAGQITVGNIQRGATSSAWIGYWVYSGVSGQGVATAACALATDHAFQRCGLHRLTATYLEANQASGTVLARNGYRREGFLRRNLHIDGRWQDHHLVAITAEDFATSCVDRLKVAGFLRG
ncbi:acetyltransferase [Corynebacterium renale]|uniref:GNAT family N-acetyltransferase n=1 Tax=Corynebacterium renale TaxID=1724 RepID=UPI000DA40ADF|nr:GNAT family protein [Corynebacterium renale]SQG64295.1 acetyltransferase [Corynebacterium renale]